MQHDAWAACNNWHHKPAMNIKLFIEQIENADPNAEDLSIDDTNEGWGHCQFTASNLTFSSVLVSWDDLGGVGIACQLIVAVIKTCKVM